MKSMIAIALILSCSVTAFAKPAPRKKATRVQRIQRFERYERLTISQSDAMQEIRALNERMCPQHLNDAAAISVNGIHTADDKDMFDYNKSNYIDGRCGSEEEFNERLEVAKTEYRRTHVHGEMIMIQRLVAAPAPAPTAPAAGAPAPVASTDRNSNTVNQDWIDENIPGPSGFRYCGEGDCYDKKDPGAQ